MRWATNPIKPIAVYGQAVNRLHRKIHLGLIMPGEKLPPERVFAEELGVSRMSLREALRVLDTEGYLRTKRGALGGTFLCNQSEFEVLRDAHIARDPAGAIRATEFRVTNEKLAVGLAAERRQSIHLNRMSAALDEMKTTSEMAVLRREEINFRFAVVEASLNLWLQDAVAESLAAVSIPAYGKGLKLEAPDAIQVYTHLFAAIQSQNSEEATKQITTILDAEIAALKHITRHEPGSAKRRTVIAGA